MAVSIYLNDAEFRALVALDFESGDPKKIIHALLSVVLNFDDYNLAVGSTSRFFAHEDRDVRGVSIICISHIARIWRKLPSSFLTQVELSLNDQDTWISGKADDTIDDLEIFIDNYKRPKNLT